MKNTFLPILVLLMVSCGKTKEVSSLNKVNWQKREARVNPGDSLASGMSYLSIYSEIYSLDEHETHDLTATVSLRNINPQDTIYINSAAYYNTHGARIRSYFDKPIFIAPLETVEIIIDKVDKEGGTGANFLFDWSTPLQAAQPHFEAVMISTSGQQGISFTTQGVKVE
ncbi:MAG: hypothetical protein CL868_09410 [Cytophagaceae bacterium]|nr:hypothetical protein [Cytophagaceae bacterium]|tara:strand:- start:327 stop:833 length:507 start_codon:yes stop_codon:yes gene_type:complete